MDIIEPFLMEGSWDIILQSCSGRLLQLWQSWYSFMHENDSKIVLFDLKIVKYLIMILTFFWYLIRFNSDIVPWPIVSKGKIWSTRWSNIYPDRMVGSKSSTFLVSLVRVFGLTLAKNGEIDFRFLHHHLIGVNYVTFNLFPAFGFKNHSFHPFLCFKALFWRVNQGRTKNQYW